MDYYRVNELPDTTSRYQAYTDQFESWLIKTTAKRGLEMQANAEEAAQGRTKKGKRKKQHEVPISRLMTLAKGIAESNVPLDDTSGLNYLRDTIRLRKEATEWYRIQGKSDTGHPFFISKFVQVRDILTDFHRTVHRDHDIVDERPNHIIISDESGDEDEQITFLLQSDILMPGSLRWSHQKIKERTSSNKSHSISSWTKEEIELEQNFEVLCFLYDFNQVRHFVQQA